MLKLELLAQQGYMSLVTSFTENAGTAFGLDSDGVMAMVLAVEEIMATLSQLKVPLTMEARDGIYYAELDLSFPNAELPLAKCNITASISAQNDEDFEHMGWLLASRTVDRFDISQLPGRMTRIRLRKYKEYSECPEQAPMPDPQAEFDEIRQPDPQELLLFCQRALQQEDVEPNFAGIFSPAARLLDMVGSREFDALVAFSDRGDPIGGVIVDRTRPSLAIMHGPMVFVSSPGLSQQLFHAVLNSLARTSVQGVVTETVHTTVPESEMERLGGRQLTTPDGATIITSTHYRHLREDEGFIVWSTPWIRSFLKTEYSRLTLAREIQTWRRTATESDQQPSVISCEFRRRRSEVMMRPVLAGNDVESNVREHLELLREEGFLNITFMLDLGQSFQLAYSDALEKCGFVPNCLVPSAGKGDLLLFNWDPK